MDSAASLQKVLDCLRAHGALITRADIEWAFNSEKNLKQIDDFIEQYLRKETLLSLEEKQIYEDLKSKDLLSSEAPPLSSRPADDEEVAKELKALELENEFLKQNIERLSSLKSEHQMKTRAENLHQNSLVQNRENLQRSYASERDQNAAAIDDLEANFRASLSDLQNASGKLSFTMSAMSEVTHNDDRILARLQSFLSDILLASDRSGDQLISAAMEYADMLATLEEQIIKTRLDRTFFKFVASAKPDEMEGQPYLDGQEFNDLIIEVAAVASMRAKDGLLQPILQNLTSDSKSRSATMAQRCSYISNTLDLLDARNKEAEAEISNRNNMQYVSGRMQTLFDLSMRDFHDSMQSQHRSSVTQAKLNTPAPAPQPSASDEKMAFLENRIWRLMGITSLNPEEGLAKAIAGRQAKVQAKEDLYKQLWTAHLKYIQEGEGVVEGLENCVGSGGAASGRLGHVEDRVKSMSAEVGQLASRANARDIPKMTVINNLKEKEMYGT